MPHLRLTADRRGYESTFLLHSSAVGERAKVIYWYRTAPGLRIGRPALDDAAMRRLEETYPDIDFDWPYLLDMASMTPVEVEGPLPVRKHKPRKADDDIDAEMPPEPVAAAGLGAPPVTPAALRADPAAEGAAEPHYDLLGELMGKGIASSLRANHQDLAAQLEGSPADPALKAAWRERLAAIDPDGWASPDDVLAGMASVERDGEELRRAIEATEASG